MFYRQQRSTVPASRYGGDLDIIEVTGWTWQELQAQPCDLVDELRIRLQKRAIARKEADGA